MEIERPDTANDWHFLLFERDQHRLEMVRDQLYLLASLTLPRSRDEEGDFAPVPQGVLSNSFLSLAEQIESVLAELQWPAQLKH